MRTRLVCVIALLAAGPVRASSDPAVTSTIDRIAMKYLETTPLVGFGVTVTRRGVVIHDAGYGRAQVSPEIPADRNTRFDYFSIGKHITSALVLRLEERGLLNLDSLGGKYLPELDTLYSTVTLRQMLSHMTGCPDHEIDERKTEPRFLVPPTRADLLAWIAKGRRLVPPGATWMYTNDGFIAASLIAEQVSGSSYGDLVRREFSGPLGLENFGFEASPRAQAYMIVEGKPVPVPPIPYAWFSGAGSICGTLGDLVRWWAALRSGRVLSEPSLAAMMTPVTLQWNGASTEFGYGLGVRLGRYGGHRMVGHTGDGGGGTAVLVEYPDDSLVIAIATNTGGGTTPHAIMIEAEIARALLNITYGEPIDRPVPRELLEKAPGRYFSQYGSFCVTARDSSLFESDDGEKPYKLLHQGDGVFRRAGSTGAELCFMGEPGKKQWFAYRVNGYTMDLAMRDADACP